MARLGLSVASAERAFDSQPMDEAEAVLSYGMIGWPAWVHHEHREVLLLVGIALLAVGGHREQLTFLIAPGHVHAAASGVALLIAFVVLALLFGGGKSSCGNSGK